MNEKAMLAVCIAQHRVHIGNPLNHRRPGWVDGPVRLLDQHKVVLPDRSVGFSANAAGIGMDMHLPPGHLRLIYSIISCVLEFRNAISSIT
jgi:hypothetical protein